MKQTAIIIPARYGSSLKYSKFLPQSGLLFIFIPGPRIMSTPKETASAC